MNCEAGADDQDDHLHNDHDAHHQSMASCPQPRTSDLIVHVFNRTTGLSLTGTVCATKVESGPEKDSQRALLPLETEAKEEMWSWMAPGCAF